MNAASSSHGLSWHGGDPENTAVFRGNKAQSIETETRTSAFSPRFQWKGIGVQNKFNRPNIMPKLWRVYHGSTALSINITLNMRGEWVSHYRNLLPQGKEIHQKLHFILMTRNICCFITLSRVLHPQLPCPLDSTGNNLFSSSSLPPSCQYYHVEMGNSM